MLNRCKHECSTYTSTWIHIQQIRASPCPRIWRRRKQKAKHQRASKFGVDNLAASTCKAHEWSYSLYQLDSTCIYCMIEEQNVDMVKSQNGQCFDHPPRILSITRTNPAWRNFRCASIQLLAGFLLQFFPGCYKTPHRNTRTQRPPFFRECHCQKRCA